MSLAMGQKKIIEQTYTYEDMYTLKCYDYLLGGKREQKKLMLH